MLYGDGDGEEENEEIGRMNVHFFFNDTATTEIYTLSLHDALPISLVTGFKSNINLFPLSIFFRRQAIGATFKHRALRDRKSTRLNSSHIPLPRMPSSA